MRKKMFLVKAVFAMANRKGGGGWEWVWATRKERGDMVLGVAGGVKDTTGTSV